MNIFTIVKSSFSRTRATRPALGQPRQLESSDWTAMALTTFSALSLVATPLLGIGLAAASAVAKPDYYDCALDMTEAGVSEADAIAACAAARYPEDLGACVADISELTGLAAEGALVVCGRSRRPTEVANCTIDIHDALLDSPSTAVLNNCGRALLPERYGTCVLDITDATEVALDNALGQCLRAGFRPWNIQPRS